MTAKELMIGNLISDINDNLCIVSSTQEDFITAKYLGIGSALGGLENFKPVLITEDMLKGYGFEKEIDTMCLSIEKVGIKIKFDKYGIRIGFGSYIELKHIRHIHELQRLYLSLTGEELTIK